MTRELVRRMRSLPRRHLRRAGLAAALVAAFLFGLAVAPAGDDAHDHARRASVEPAGDTIWTCSMHPQVRSPEPGQCPICGMDLIPATSAPHVAEDPARVTLSPAARERARIRTVEVRRGGGGTAHLSLLGRIEPDESRVRLVTAWTGGRIDDLAVATTGEVVRKGQVIARLYSPELYAAQQDLIQARVAVDRLAAASEPARQAAESALQAARKRLELLGVPKSEVASMASHASPSQHVAIRSPFDGIVLEKRVDEGQYVQPGSGIYQLAELTVVWVQLDAYETDLPHVNVGQPVKLRVDALPGRELDGRIAFIDPVVDSQTRSARVRVEVPNRELTLKPGMFAEARVAVGGGQDASQQLFIPESAALLTGRRSVVYVEVPGAEQPTYEAREVRLGARKDEQYPVIGGLSQGERVVAHGAFALDADLQIRGGASMMTRGDDREPGAYDAAVSVTPEQRRALAPVVRAYLEVQQALAGDDLDAARRAAGRVAGSSRRVAAPSLGAAAESWARLARAFEAHASALAEAASLDEARAAFAPLSDQALELLRSFGNPLERPLHVAFCPMAFDDKGADWVQQGDTIANSYFGASMFRCGEIRQRVDAGTHAATPTAQLVPRAAAPEPEGHQH